MSAYGSRLILKQFILREKSSLSTIRQVSARKNSVSSRITKCTSKNSRIEPLFALSSIILITASYHDIAREKIDTCCESHKDENIGLKDKEKLSSPCCCASPSIDNSEQGEIPSPNIPSYISENFREALGASLDHGIPLSKEARQGILSEGTFPVEIAKVTLAPDVPPPIKRSYPVHLIVDMVSINKKLRVSGSKKYEFWPFGFYDHEDGSKVKVGIPGPMIRARVGDVLQINHTNLDSTGMAHSVDFHSVSGPGGGSPTTFAEQGESKTGYYLLDKPGLFVYHCAAAPIPVHINNGMFGLILVEPQEGLPPVDREFYIMQHELYVIEDDDNPKTEYITDYKGAEDETPKHVLFNGRENRHVEQPLMANTDETVRIFFGNAGPNLISSFHIIGAVLDRVYREGDIVSPPAKCIQTTLVPSGGSAVIETKFKVPGNYTLVDHSINRIDKGAIGFVKVKGKPRPDIYDSKEPPILCPACKTHN